MEGFGAYIKTITALTIFSALACMLMPDGSFRKYLELVLGALVLATVLQPFLQLFGGAAGDMELGILRNRLRLEETLLSPQAYLEIEQQRLDAAYAAVLEEKIEEDIRKKFPEIEWVRVDFCRDTEGENYGMPEQITIGSGDEAAEKIHAYTAKRYGLAETAVSVEN